MVTKNPLVVHPQTVNPIHQGGQKAMKLLNIRAGKMTSREKQPTAKINLEALKKRCTKTVHLQQVNWVLKLQKREVKLAERELVLIKKELVLAEKELILAERELILAERELPLKKSG